MKRYLTIVLLVILTVLTAVNYQKVRGDTSTDDSKEIIMELSIDQKKFFDKKNEAEKYNELGILVVDTINGIKAETIDIDDTAFEKDALMYGMYLHNVNGSLQYTIEKNKQYLSASELDNLNNLIGMMNDSNSANYEQMKNYMDDTNFFEYNKIFLKSLVPDTIIIDSRDYSMTADFSYTTIYTGYYMDYDNEKTIAGIYSIQAEYYTYFFQKIYTGATRYVLNTTFEEYEHIDSFTFGYQSFLVLWIQAPYADITLVYDYWGKEKMIIDSPITEISYRITQEEHYARNQYNQINGIDVGTIYETETDLGNNFGNALSLSGSYFHQLLPDNTGNTKYLKNIDYYDVNYLDWNQGLVENEGIIFEGQCELVYNEDGELANLYDENGVSKGNDLITYSFNFGVESSYPGLNPGDAHYLRDVYPYLIWGNTKIDGQNHSAFERFVWDKDSVQGIVTGTYLGKNLEGTSLTNLFINGQITSYGESIPTEFILNPYGWNLFFDYIQTQTVPEDTYSNINWSSFIMNIYNGSGGIIVKFEEYDHILYNTQGIYPVKVGIRDIYGQERTQVFYVIVTQKLSVPSC